LKAETRVVRHLEVPMNLTCCESGNTVTISLIGELDHHAARPAMNAIGGILETKLPVTCVLDMADISFMDSSGIAVLLNAHKRMGELGGKLRLLNPSRQAVRVISAAGLDRVMEIM